MHKEEYRHLYSTSASPRAIVKTALDMHEEEYRHVYSTLPFPRAIVKASWDMHKEEYRHLYWTSPSPRAVIKAARDMHVPSGFDNSTRNRRCPIKVTILLFVHVNVPSGFDIVPTG
jgi:Leu/Phe-tRNA-protein transferase